MKMLKVSPYYLQSIDYVYNSNIGLTGKSYAQQHQTIIEARIGWSDFWEMHLKAHDIEVVEIIVNAEAMQRTWAAEHDLVILGSDWQKEVLVGQIRHFRPDVLFVQDFHMLDDDFVKKVRSEFSCIKFVIGYDGVGKDDASLFVGCDLVLSCLKDSVAYYENASSKLTSGLFKLGFETSLSNKVAVTSQSQIDLIFMGSVYLFSGGHYNRLNYLSKIIDKCDMDLHIANLNVSKGAFLRDHLWLIKHKKWEIFFAILKLYRRNQPPLFGLSMLERMANTNISTNFHIDATQGNAANIRLFEATGMGSCLLTDGIKNIEDFFVPDSEIVAFSNVDECLEKLEFLQNNPKTREQIAKAGQARTIKDHNLKSSVDAIGVLLNSGRI